MPWRGRPAREGSSPRSSGWRAPCAGWTERGWQSGRDCSAGRRLPSGSSRSRRRGGRRWRAARAAAAVTGWDLETIGACAGAIGDLGEAVALLLEPGGATPPPLSAARFARRELLSRPRAKFAGGDPPTAAPSGGVRTGADILTVEEAIARAFDADREAVARARRDCGDIGETAVAARDARLHEITFRLFHPIGFMLASPIEDPAKVVPELPGFAIEQKFDGIRAHAHKSGSRVALFSRTLDDITVQFPELAVALALAPGEFLLDGEIVAWRRTPGQDGSPETEGPDAFQRLQRRLGREAPDPELLLGVPTAFLAYDCLARDGQPLFEETWRERRRHLEEIAAAWERLRVSEVFAAGTAEEMESLFTLARARGNEGLMLKRLASTDQAGKRGRAWRKWKKALATLDVVVTAVEQGHGKRAGMLSDYTFAVRDGDRFVNIGKAESGLTDEEIRQMGTRFRAITTGRYGPVRAVRPEVVIEVAFDTIQKSNRHKSGYALRFPRIVRLRPDRIPADISTLEDVRQLVEFPSPPGRGTVEI